MRHLQRTDGTGHLLVLIPSEDADTSPVAVPRWITLRYLSPPNPVDTPPDHRGRGLGKAVVLHALHRGGA
jgi:hypothetical protein